MVDTSIPTSFWLKRVHSLAGFGLMLYIIFHLFTNSQAALWFGEDGKGFIHSVNDIQNTPYLLAVEIMILGIPICIHAYLGLRYLFKADMNSFGNTGTQPYLPEFSRNHAYTWQRITSWILLFGLTFHIVHMRFIEHPIFAKEDNKSFYMVRLNEDSGLHTVANRLGVEVLDRTAIEKEKLKPLKLNDEKHVNEINKQLSAQRSHYLEMLQKQPLSSNQVIAVAKDFGTAELLIVRDVFKSPLMMGIYTIFVFAACFHAFNGLWTFLITWGLTITLPSQQIMLYFSTFLMACVTLLGLITIYGTYWINLRQ